MIRDQFVGAFSLGLAAPGPVPQEQIETARELAVQLAVGLEQARLYGEVQRHAGELEELVRERTAALPSSGARFRAIFADCQLDSRCED